MTNELKILREAVIQDVEKTQRFFSNDISIHETRVPKKTFSDLALTSKTTKCNFQKFYQDCIKGRVKKKLEAEKSNTSDYPVQIKKEALKDSADDAEYPPVINIISGKKATCDNPY